VRSSASESEENHGKYMIAGKNYPIQVYLWAKSQNSGRKADLFGRNKINFSIGLLIFQGKFA